VTIATSSPASALSRRDDRHLLAGQRVEQARLADVRRADQDHVQPVAQHRALARAGEHVVELAADRRQAAARVGRLQEVDLLLGEVQRRLDQRAQLEQRLDQGVDAPRELAGQRAVGRPCRRLGAGVDQVGDCLGLGEVEAVVEEGAAGEFARRGHAQADRAACLQAARQQHLQHHRPAVALQFEHRLAGVGVRRRKQQRDALVDRPPLRVEEGCESGVPGRQPCRALSAEQALDHRRQVGAGNTHHADAGATRCGGNGGNRVAVGEHGKTLTQRCRRLLVRLPRPVTAPARCPTTTTRSSSTVVRSPAC